MPHTKPVPHHHTTAECGERVGLGWACSACFQCDTCNKDQTPQLCPKVQQTVFQYGGMAERLRCDYRMAVPIPYSIKSEVAAPLMGCGVTAFDAVSKHVTKDSEVAVVGVGGVGHLAVKFAVNKGAKVTCFSHSSLKEDKAIDEWDAYHFVYVSEEDSAVPPGYKSVFDVVIFTSPVKYNHASLFNAAKTGGKVVMIGASSMPVFVPDNIDVTIEAQRKLPLPMAQPITPAAVADDAKKVTLAYVDGGSPADIKATLEYVAEHKITPDVKVSHFNDAPAVYNALAESSEMRHVFNWSVSHL